MTLKFLTVFQLPPFSGGRAVSQLSACVWPKYAPLLIRAMTSYIPEWVSWNKHFALSVIEVMKDCMVHKIFY
jgi:hypothetical protein